MSDNGDLDSDVEAVETVIESIEIDEENPEISTVEIFDSTTDEDDDDDDDDDEDDDDDDNINTVEISDSDSDEYDEDDDEDDERRFMNKYLDVLTRIGEDKYNYSNYVDLVDVAHDIGDLDKIRQSCELFYAVYPLSPSIWLRWIKIELNISTNESEIQAVHELFRKAFKDYFCPTLALEYANLAIKSPKSNEIWDEILSTYALHCKKGRALFEAWRVHYQETEPESPEKWKKIIEIYEKELTIPLYNMEDTYIEFKVLCEKNKEKIGDVDWEHIDEKYHREKEHLSRMLPFERRLEELDARHHQDRAKIYKQYIEECRSFLSEQIIQVIYERMITDCCLDTNCWLAYIQYVHSRGPLSTANAQSLPVFKQTVEDIVDRALRNCTWSEELYVEKLRIAEKDEQTKQQVQVIAEAAFAAGFQTPEPLVTIWLEYLSYLRRNTSFDNEKESDILRANFALAWDSLGRQFDVLADSNCEILQMWGRLEYGPLNDLSKGKELWTTVMESADNPNKSGLWIEFAHLELKKGVDGARKVFRKAVSSPEIDDLDVVISAWTRFERCNGTVDQLKACQEQCNLIKSKADYAARSRNQFERKRKFPLKEERKPFSRDSNKNRAPNNREKKSKPAATSDTETVLYIKKHKAEDSINNDISQKRQKLDSKPYVNDQNPNSGEHAIDPAKDHVTVFLSNLSYDLTEDEIKAALPELHVQNINVVKGSAGKSRGFAYVEVLSPREVTLALTFDRRLINGRPVFISKVVREKEKRGVFKYAESLEPTKLFIKGLPYDATKEELEQLFGEFGQLKDTRLVCHKNGKSKGIAYVEYQEESSASRAVLKLDQFELRGFKISVAISAPPPKAKPGQSSVAPENLVGLGQGRRNNIPKGDQRPRLSFIPRSVQKAVQASTSTTNGSAASTSEPLQSAPAAAEASEASEAPAASEAPPVAEAPRTNDDFRKLLEKS